MAPGKNKTPSNPSASAREPATERGAKPAWADGLRQLYDSVVDEPLPSNLQDLLAQLDQDSDSKSPQGGSR